MIDVVIPLIKGGSHKNDLELRYCLRSIEKYLTGYRNIVIVGHLPEFIQPDSVIHIPFKDSEKKQANIRNKILAAFEDESDTIMFFNDDFTLLKPLFVGDCKNWYDGCLSNASEKAARILYKELKEKGYQTRHFDIHVPIIYEKEKFKESAYKFSEEGSIKSAYGNYWNVESEPMKDFKISSKLRYSTIVEATKDRHFVSWGDFGITHESVRFLNDLFSNKSKYEL